MDNKILHLIGGGEIGGAEHHILNLLAHYPNHVKPELICLAKNSPLAAEAQKRGFSAHILPMSFFMDFRPILKITHFCREKKIDLIHTHGMRGNLLGRLAAGRAHIPCISTVHSDPLADYTSRFKGRIAVAVDNWSLPKAAGFITISRSLYEMMLTRLEKPVPITTIYNGAPIYDFSGGLREKYREMWQIPDDAIVLGTIGRLHPVKGQSLLVETAGSLQQSGKKIHLVIIGEGPLHRKLESELKASTVPYTLPGYVPDAWQALPAMDIFALPSLKEGMGLVLLEAAQAGLPIVATRTGGIPELFPHQEALLVTPGDSLSFAAACSSVLDDPVLRQRITQKAAERAGQFSLDKMAVSTTRFYERILAFTER
jgi:glycosyltransferase involved in cell wall biosynthesis